MERQNAKIVKNYKLLCNNMVAMETNYFDSIFSTSMRNMI